MKGLATLSSWLPCLGWRRAITYGWLDESRHPNVGAMFFQRTDTTSPTRLCSGTLIAPTVFVTASHCTAYLDRLAAQGLLSWVGVSFKPTRPTTRHYPRRPLPNPAYYDFNGIDAGDVGVVVLDDAPAATRWRLSRPLACSMPGMGRRDAV